MRLSEESLKRQATTYVKDGVLIKWIFDTGCDDDEFYIRMNEKYRNQEPLTAAELQRIKEGSNVVISVGGNLGFINFTGIVLKG